MKYEIDFKYQYLNDYFPCNHQQENFKRVFLSKYLFGAKPKATTTYWAIGGWKYPTFPSLLLPFSTASLSHSVTSQHVKLRFSSLLSASPPAHFSLPIFSNFRFLLSWGLKLSTLPITASFRYLLYFASPCISSFGFFISLISCTFLWFVFIVHSPEKTLKLLKSLLLAF